MAKNAKKGASRAAGDPPRKSTSTPLLAAFVAGILATLGAQWLFDARSAQSGSADLQASESEPGEREFEFYTLLGNLEVRVPDAGPISAEDDNIIYWLQAASFRDSEDAENLRVTLLLMNMEAEVEAVTHDGKVWHRVIAGPFETRTLLAKAKENLIREGIQPITLRQTLEE